MKIDPNIKDSDNRIKSKIFQEISWEIIFPLFHNENENNKINQQKKKDNNEIIVNNSNSKIKNVKITKY